MPAFICCNPGCGNILYSSGPIVTLISHQNTQFALSVEDTGGLSDESLNQVRRFAALPGFETSVKLQIDQPLPGSISHFDVKTFDVHIPAQVTAPMVQTITLRCNHCGTYCTYQI